MTPTSDHLVLTVRKHHKKITLEIMLTCVSVFLSEKEGEESSCVYGDAFPDASCGGKEESCPGAFCGGLEKKSFPDAFCVR